MEISAGDTVITEHFVVTTKMAGTLVQGSEESENCLLDDLKREGIKEKLHLLTRLDRPVSGLVLLAKEKSFNRHYLDQQEKENVSKEYLAIVEGHFVDDERTLVHFHRKDSKYKKARIEENETKGYKKVTLVCHCLKQLNNYTILKLILKRGRFHQIRAQLAFIGHPIKGDVKYGARRKNADRSIYLHAYKIKFTDLNKNVKSYVVKPDSEDKLWQLIDFTEE